MEFTIEICLSITFGRKASVRQQQRFGFSHLGLQGCSYVKGVTQNDDLIIVKVTVCMVPVTTISQKRFLHAVIFNW